MHALAPLLLARIEKAAADCGFELGAQIDAAGVTIRSATFPEWLRITALGDQQFAVVASHPLLLSQTNGSEATQVDGFDALYTVLQKASATARTMPNRVADRFREQAAKFPATTEAERLVVQRVGQNLFREALLDFWQGRCCVTGLAVPALLRASHIKPWAACSNDNERLDVFNGLLLAPQVDALFDGGWITFDDGGVVKVSDQLPLPARAQLGVASAWRLPALNAAQSAYLAFHRGSVFRS